MADDRGEWHPIATSGDLVARHVFQGQLLGRELAVWRADDNYVNVWENRCMHRGVRLTVGSNDGNELICRYHGWRYASRSAGCTYIPAHPADAPARTICNRTFPAIERFGLVWTTADGSSTADDDDEVGLGNGRSAISGPWVPELRDGPAFVLRNLPVNAPAALVRQHLATHTFEPTGTLDVADASTQAQVHDDRIVLTAATAFLSDAVVFFIQPVDSARSVIRPVLAGSPPDAASQSALLRHHATRLRELVERIEADAQLRPLPAPLEPAIERVPNELAVLPEPSLGRSAPLRVRVARAWSAAADVRAFELAPVTGSLPTAQPGAHIDVHLPNGLVRQYSLTNGPGETAFYRIGVKRADDSTGGSSCLHDVLRIGDVLAISEPRNNFPLRRDAERTLLIAGGIGVTPLLSMAQTLDSNGLDFELHYFAQSADRLAFRPILDRLGARVHTHLARTPKQTTVALESLLADAGEWGNVYLCGPAPMLAAARTLASQAGWADRNVRFEYFANTNEIDDSSSFEIALARSAMTLPVAAGQSVLSVLRANRIPVPSSCEQGACGTCLVGVLDGDIDHQDVYLNDSDRQVGDRMITCVSRAAGERLVLDL